jgi:cytochrome c-type biogenesis protein CcmE
MGLEARFLISTRPRRRLQAGGEVSFTIADRRKKARVSYRGDLPDLFREGQGVVASGAFDASGVFEASQILAKHDERYMPRELTRALKAQGEWRGASGDGQTS